MSFSLHAYFPIKSELFQVSPLNSVDRKLYPHSKKKEKVNTYTHANIKNTPNKYK